MIEDDDSKIRRNLLLFSALVILAEWFDLQLGDLIGDVLKLKTPLDPLKLCTAALTILLYLALRYRYAHLVDDKNYRDIVAADLAVIEPKVAFHYAQAMVNLYTLTGFEASIFLGHLKTYVKHRAAGLGEGLETVRPKIHLHAYKRDAAGQSQSNKIGKNWDAGTTIVWVKPSQASTSGGSQLAIENNGIHRCFIWAYSRAWLFSFSEAAIRARFPVLFGLIAVTLLCTKVWMTLAIR